MTTNFPTALDDATVLPNISSSDDMNTTGKEHDVMHTNLANAILALEQKVGINGSTDTTSLDYKISNIGGVTRVVNAVASSSINNWAGYSIRTVIPGYLMLNGRSIRFTLVSNFSTTTTFACNGAYVGVSSSSSAQNYASTPTPITFGGSTSFSVAGGGAVISDWIPFTCNQNVGIVVGLQFTSGDAAGFNYDTGMQGYYGTGANASSMSSSLTSTGNFFLKAIDIMF